MKQHKWHKEIKAWADGAEIEVKTDSNSDWKSNDPPFWWVEDYQFRIKPQTKKPQYLYVYDWTAIHWQYPIKPQQDTENEN